MQTIAHQGHCVCRRSPLFRTQVPDGASSSTRWARRASIKDRLEAPGLRPEPWTSSPQQEQALGALRTRMARMASGNGGSMSSDDETLRWGVAGGRSRPWGHCAPACRAWPAATAAACQRTMKR